MIGIVLAAGAGRRLRPHTGALAKALVPVGAGRGGGWRVASGGGSAGETTILDIALRNLAQVGIVEVAVVVGYAAGALLLNGDTVHPVSVEETLLSQPGRSGSYRACRC